MDIISLTQALVTLLAPLLPYLIKAGEKSVEEIGKNIGASAWSLAKKIWSRLSPKINARPAAKEAVNDLAENPNDNDSIAAFRIQIRKILESDSSLANELYSQLHSINNAARDVNINFGGIHVGGNVYGGNFVSGTGNVFQNGQYNYHYTVNVNKTERIVRENRATEIKEIEVKFLQPDGTYPKHSWVDKANTLEIMLGQNSKTANEKWEPAGIDFSILKGLLLKEINRWTQQGWELMENDIDKLFISDYNSAETIGSAVGRILTIPTGLAWNHWRIYYGARFHIRRPIE